MEKWEQKTLISELLQGMELGKELRSHLTATSSPEAKEMLVQRILTSYDKALMILNWRGAMVQTPTTENEQESPLSNNGSPWNDNSEEDLKDHQEHKDISKKRKLMPTWTHQVRINSENEVEGAHEDGYSWRKYGQKGILGTKHPRSYYRCTFRKSQNCWATKKVQRSEDDPPVLDITYQGRHTCTHANQSIPAPASSEKQEKKLDNQELGKSQEAIFNFRANLRVNTELDNTETESPFPFTSASFGCTKSENHTFLPSEMDCNHLLGCYSPSFLSPSTPEANHFSLPAGQMSYFGGGWNLPPSASGLGEMISANTSGTNSPIMNLDFSLDHVEIDPFIPFDSKGFFS